MNSLLQKILIVIGTLVLLRILWSVLAFLFPLILILVLIYAVYSLFFKKKEEVKWYDGTMSDSYYQKERAISDAIDVDVKVKRSEDDPFPGKK
ncbi:MAG: hypothetical protein IIZ47_03590 [Erysipelotrichaceae bacterium]|nr:hypothetical protein [Erysipelotrichaceae bacterium]